MMSKQINFKYCCVLHKLRESKEKTDFKGKAMNINLV